MKKVLIIIGSRQEANSYTLGKKLFKELQKERIPVSTIIPGNQKIYLCTGCMDCDQKGFCDFKDDMSENIRKVRESNILIFITPVRWNLLSGDLKIFMDRLNPLYASEELKGKKMIALAIGAKEKSTYSSEGAITSLGSFAESADMQLVMQDTINHCLTVDDLKEKEEAVINLIHKITSMVKTL